MFCLIVELSVYICFFSTYLRLCVCVCFKESVVFNLTDIMTMLLLLLLWMLLQLSDIVCLRLVLWFLVDWKCKPYLSPFSLSICPVRSKRNQKKWKTSNKFFRFSSGNNFGTFVMLKFSNIIKQIIPQLQNTWYCAPSIYTAYNCAKFECVLIKFTECLYFHTLFAPMPKRNTKSNN